MSLIPSLVKSQALGDDSDKLNVPVYKFLKEPLIRAFGEDYYQELELVAPEIEQIEP